MEENDARKALYAAVYGIPGGRPCGGPDDIRMAFYRFIEATCRMDQAALGIDGAKACLEIHRQLSDAMAAAAISNKQFAPDPHQYELRYRQRLHYAVAARMIIAGAGGNPKAPAMSLFSLADALYPEDPLMEMRMLHERGVAKALDASSGW